MNCLISFTREMEEDINQERDNFQGLFYYLDMKQSNSIGRSEESIPLVFLPCTPGSVLGSGFFSRMTELCAGACSRLSVCPELLPALLSAWDTRQDSCTAPLCLSRREAQEQSRSCPSHPRFPFFMADKEMSA